MNSLVIEPHYLGSLEYYALLLDSESIVLEVNDYYQKQTYRNRCYLLGSNKILTLTVPVSYSSKTLTKDVTVDNFQRWKKDHNGAFYSAYGKAPFYEFFAEDLEAIWRKDYKYLVDLSVDLLILTFKWLRKDVKMTLSDSYKEKVELDFRDVIIPKKTFVDRKIYQEVPYTQLFGDNFIPNLSIIDLIMCEGPGALDVLTASFLKH